MLAFFERQFRRQHCARALAWNAGRGVGNTSERQSVALALPAAVAGGLPTSYTSRAQINGEAEATRPSPTRVSLRSRGHFSSAHRALRTCPLLPDPSRNAQAHRGRGGTAPSATHPLVEDVAATRPSVHCSVAVFEVFLAEHARLVHPNAQKPKLAEHPIGLPLAELGLAHRVARGEQDARLLISAGWGAGSTEWLAPWLLVS